VRCRPSIVRQLNMVAGFGGKGEIHSIYAPHFCKDCDEEFQVLIDLANSPDIVRSRRVPEQKCPSCEEIAELDESPDSYLAFLEDYPAPKADHEVEAVLIKLKIREMAVDVKAASDSIHKSAKAKNS
jgi:hypothetical protein